MLEGIMSKLLLTVCLSGLLLSFASAQEWSKDEITAGVRKAEYMRHVPAGKQRTLETFTFLNPDCTANEDLEVTITKEPEHGSATITSAEGFPHYAKDNVRSKCNDKKVKGKVLNYKPAVGYVGNDVFEVMVLMPNGMAGEYVYNIKVVDPSKNKGRAELRP